MINPELSAKIKWERLVAERARDKAVREKRGMEIRLRGGVCPCCNRNFPNLASHMGSKHKNFALPPGRMKEIEGPSK